MKLKFVGYIVSTIQQSTGKSINSSFLAFCSDLPEKEFETYSSVEGYVYRYIPVYTKETT